MSAERRLAISELTKKGGKSKGSAYKSALYSALSPQNLATKSGKASKKK